MSASRNADASSNQPGQIGSHVERDEPQTTKGHKPGILVGNDAAPSFHAQTLPHGTAPASNTFHPNPINETPGQADNDATLRSHGKESTYTSASDTLGGTTSAAVHTGFGHPGQGQTSQELHQGGGGGARGGGLAGVGAAGAASGNQGLDARVQESQRAGGKEEGVLAGQRGDKGAVAAEDLPNESA